MKINRNNYEAYFLDYIEGNLPVALVNDFIDFLQQNPDLKDELEPFESVSVKPENILFNTKEKLYHEKYDSEKEFNNAAIATIENDISEKEKIDFEKYLFTHPEKERDYFLFKKTRLHADKSITFNKKKRLFHISLQREIFIWSGRVAVLLVLALLIAVLVAKNADLLIPKNNKVAVATSESNRKEAPQAEEKNVVQSEKQTKKPVAAVQKKNYKHKNPLHQPTQAILTVERVPVEVPAKMRVIPASLQLGQPNVTLAAIKLIHPETPRSNYEERLIANVVKEKIGLDKFKFNKISKAGLTLLSNISKNRFQYQTNKKGKVTEYKFDSRLLAFTIPTKNEGAGQ